MRMDIKTYLAKTGKTQASFAKELGVTQGLINQLISGFTNVKAERAVQIHTITNGAVSKHELRPDLWP